MPYIGCGDCPHHIVDSLYRYNGINVGVTETLGTVKLLDDETYTSCRQNCKRDFPDFDFYQKYENFHFCHCYKVVSGNPMRFRKHGAYTFGFRTFCGNII